VFGKISEVLVYYLHLYCLRNVWHVDNVVVESVGMRFCFVYLNLYE